MATGVWFGGPRSVELRSETLDMRADQVRVRALVSALSHGTEMLVYRGQVPRELELDLPTLEGSYAFPIKFGYASVGRVVAAGAAVRDLSVGDLVFVHHPHQDEYCVAASRAIRLPPGLSPERAVFLANTETAVNVVLDAHPHLRDAVAVFGQGVVGLLVTQLLRRAGATVLAIEPVASRREISVRTGASAAMAPDDAPKLWERTGGRGVDVAVEASGNAAALQQAIDATAFGGTVVVASWYGTKPVSLALGARFHRARLGIRSSQVGTLDSSLAPRWDRERRLAVARDLLAELDLEPLITQRIPFAQAAEAYALVDARPDETIQVLLSYD